MAIDITEFERLMCESGLNRESRSHIIKYLNYIISINKGTEYDFLDNNDFFKEARVALEAKDFKIYILLTGYTKFGKLINNSKLNKLYRSYAISYITCIINTNKGKNSDFINNEDFLKTIEVILNCKQQDTEICTQLIRYLRLINNNKYYRSFIIEDMAKDENKDAVLHFLKDENLFRATEIILNSPIQESIKYNSITSIILSLKDNPSEKKSQIIRYALLTSCNVIRTYPAEKIPHRSYIHRLNNKESDVRMSDYLLDNQMIKEDISWLKKTDHKKFKELCDQVEKMQDAEIKETFDDYLNQINSEEKHKVLKHTTVALAVICVAAAIFAIATGSIIAAIIAAVTGASAVALGVCSSKLECANITKEKEDEKSKLA